VAARVAETAWSSAFLGRDARLVWLADPTGRPPTTAPSPPPQAGGGDRPVFGPDAGSGRANGGGPLNDVDPDRLPITGGGVAPGHSLDPKGGDSLDKLQKVLGNSDATIQEPA